MKEHTDVIVSYFMKSSVKDRGIILCNITVFSGGLKTTKNLIHDSRSSGLRVIKLIKMFLSD
jgi:hypothetical protein